MPDTDVKDDPLAAAFASFAAGARGQIGMPGASAARRTVARRRVGHGVAGGLAVLLVVGGVGYAASTRHRPPPPAPVAVSSPTPPPSGDSTVAGRLAELALATVLNAPGDAGTATETIANGVFQQAGTVADSDPGIRPPGTYRLSFVCAGSGTATVIWTVGLTTTTVTYACDTPPHLLVHGSTMRSTRPGGIAVTITLDGPATGTYAGAAYRVDATR